MTRGSVARLVASARHLEVGGGTGRPFRDFVDDAASRLAPDVTLAAPPTTRLLTREALARLRSPDLRFPEEPAARVALAHAVDRAIGRLRRAGTAPGHLRDTGLGHAALLGDVLDLVDAQLAAADLADARSAAGLVASRLAGAPLAGELPEVAAGAVVVTGVAAFEPDDLAVIEALHDRLRRAGGAGVRLELPRLSGPIARAPDDAVSPVADALERRWATLPDPPEIDWIDSKPAQPARVIAARTVDGEARAVAAAVIDALARGAPPERVAVVVPDLDETRLEPFRAALADAKIPFSEPRGRPVASCPEGRIALTLLAVAAGPVTREEVIELLRAPGLHPGVWMDRASLREAVARAVALAHRLREVPVEIDRTGRLLVDGLASLVRGRRSAIRPAEPAAPSPDESWMPRALERALKEARWLGADTGSAPPSRREVARRLLALLDRLEIGRPPRIDLAAALLREGRGGGPLPLRALGEGAAAVRAIREAVRSLVDGAAAAGLADRPSSAADFAAELGVAVGELGIGLGAGSSAAGAAAIRIGRPADLAGLDHDLVLVTGLDERAYSGAEGDLALLDERVRKRLPAPCRPPSAGEREAWRRAELAWAMASADHVVLSYSLGDEADMAQPHRLVRWALEHSAQPHQEPASRVARRASRIDARSAELGALAAGASPRPDVAERVAVERARMAFFLDPRAPGGAYDGRIFPLPADPGAEAPLHRRLVAAVGGDVAARPVAVTAVERAAGCAFAGFARRVLRLRRVDDLGESADARERGTLVHRALHAAFEGLRDADGALAREIRIDAARAAAERALGLSGSMAALRREALRQAVADALGVVERALDEGSVLRFLVAEQGFGAGQAAPWEALAIGGDDDGGALVWIDGQIDRVDVSADGKLARVVDYKTGKLPAAEDHGRSAFQLPLYAAVVARALACDTVEAAYVSVRPRGVVEEQPRAADERRALGARRDEIANAARRVILSMWKGEVPPRPAKASLCVRCDARDVCRRPAVAPIEEADERG